MAGLHTDLVFIVNPTKHFPNKLRLIRKHHFVFTITNLLGFERF